MGSIDVYAEMGMPAFLAVFVVVGSIVAFATAIATCFLRAAHRIKVAQRAEASIGGEIRPLVEGEDVVLFGTVRHLEDRDVAVKVSVRQTGREAESSGSWSHSWIEIDREIVVAPFLLELAGGQLVRIAPPKNVEVADALDQKVWIDRNHRVLSAELVPGEQIYARGRLERSDIAVPSSAYRDVKWGWGLVPADGQMLLSSEPLGVGLRQRATFHKWYGQCAIFFLIATQLSLVFFHQRALGDTVPATITNKHYYTSTDSEGDTSHHHVIRVSAHVVLTDPDVEIGGSDYASVDEGITVPVRRGSADNWDLGASPTLNWIHGGVVAVATFAFWCIYLARRRSSRPWFRRKVNDNGTGRLPDHG